MIEQPKTLYHYTSLDTLALILTNKTICFNTLLNVDDIEEAETSDLGLFGKFTPSDGKGMRTNSKRVYVKNLGQNMKGEDIIEIRKK